MDIPSILSSGAEQGAFFLFSVIVLYLFYRGNKDNKEQVSEITKTYSESIDKNMQTSMDRMEKMDERSALERREMMSLVRDEKRNN